jgi:hypothetical protein
MATKKKPRELERASWKAGIVGAKATVVSAILAAIALIFSVLTFVKPDSPTQHAPKLDLRGSQNPIVVEKPTINLTPQAAQKASAPSQQVTELLYGTWDGTTRFVSPAGQECLFKGYSSFLEGYTYNFRGTHVCRGVGESKKAMSTCEITAAGTWHVAQRKLVVTLIDYKAIPLRETTVEGIEIDYTKQVRITSGRGICFRDDIPKNSSQGYDIEELSTSVLRLRAKGLGGGDVYYLGTRKIM